MGIGKTIDWKQPFWNKENTAAYSWCIKHGIKIYSVPCGKGFNNKTCWIEVNVNGRKQQSPKTYGPTELWPKVMELYKFYYDKNIRK
jgi:hypothetical protein|tara:strand:- start:699 stop:959 length:261 start_codon:yes stop_codon:yes gene_type:complete